MQEKPFIYLPHSIYESERERLDIQERGRKSSPSLESLRLGEQYAQELSSGYLPEISLRFMGEEIGHGAFLEEDLDEGAYVGEYTGVVRQNDIRRYTLNNYLYTYPISDINNINYVIDATSGNLTRFINHSFNPCLKPFYAYREGFYHVIFLALRPLSKGTHLSYDYGQNYWRLRKWPTDL